METVFDFEVCFALNFAITLLWPLTTCLAVAISGIDLLPSATTDNR